MLPRLLALQSAVPPHVIAQADAARYAGNLFAQVRDIARLLPVFENTGIRQRHSCVPIEWYLADHGWQDRTRLYIDNAVALLETVTQRLLAEAALKPEDPGGFPIKSLTSEGQNVRETAFKGKVKPCWTLNF